MGKEGVKTIFLAERKDGIGGINDEAEKDEVIGGMSGEDDKENKDETKWGEEEILIGSESEDEEDWGEEAPLIGWMSVGEGKKRDAGAAIGGEVGRKSFGKGSEEEKRASGGAGSMTARSSLGVALIAVIEGDAPDDFVFSGGVMVFDHAVVPLSTETHPDVASDEAMRRQGRIRRSGKDGNERWRNNRCFGRGCLWESMGEQRRNGEWERDSRCCRRGC
jgi:hypothetical protein